MFPADNSLNKALEKRIKENSLRKLNIQENLVDFCSNDYLGFSKTLKLASSDFDLPAGSTGSRLLSGNNLLFERVENHIADFHKAESALIFNSGYDANLGFFSCVPQRNDTVIYDELVHASIRDGIRLGLAKSYSFQHNDVNDLKKKLENAKGNIFIAIESVYSMDGDFAPLYDIIQLANEYRANIFVDEAHATGIFGELGEGRVVEAGLQDKVFARLVTFGKALGCHGAAVLGNKTLKEYLINFARSFIYTTALPPHDIKMIEAAYKKLPLILKERNTLLSLIQQFKETAAHLNLIKSDSPIQCIIIPGNHNVKQVSEQLQKNGFDIRPILSPTVPAGQERIRICLHSFNTTEQIKQVLEKLGVLLTVDC